MEYQITTPKMNNNTLSIYVWALLIGATAWFCIFNAIVWIVFGRAV